MADLINNVITYFQGLPSLELLAMLLSLAYVILAAKGSSLCWPAAFFSTALYTLIFFDVLLLMDSALNAYYLLMAIYGYWQWTFNNDAEEENNELSIVSLPLSYHLKVFGVLALISIAVGYVMTNYTPAHFPYLDSFTTVFAVFATYLITQKVLENWLYWIVIDAASIYLYVQKGLIPTTILFIIFVVVSYFGYKKWLHIYQSHQLSRQPTPDSV